MGVEDARLEDSPSGRPTARHGNGAPSVSETIFWGKRVHCFESDTDSPNSGVARYDAGEMLFWEGQPCDGMFLIVKGTVKIFKTSQSGRELVIGLESAPWSVAELPLFDGVSYPASTCGEQCGHLLHQQR